ncbi:MAG: SEC-C domain-containing protein [Nitrospinae bacterium]|nr:SEC-C domain-containing protein [Nitrospinota bacterium]
MSSYIWSLEKLSGLSNHKDPLVREWVLERLPALYPGKTAEIALRLINDPDEMTSLRAINYFGKSKSNGACTGQFLESFRKSSWVNASEIANLLSKAGETALCGALKEKYPSPLKNLDAYSAALIPLARLRSGDSQKIVLDSLGLLGQMKNWDAFAAENIFFANLIAGNGLNSLLDFCFNHSQKHEATLLLLTKLLAHCGSWYSKERFEDNGEEGGPGKSFPPVVRETLDYLTSLGMGKAAEIMEKQWEEKNFTGFIEEIHKEAMLLLEMKKQETGEEKYRKWAEGDEVPLHNADAITAIHGIVKTAPEEFHELLAKAALVIFSYLLEYKSFIGISLDGANPYYLLKIFMEDRNDHAQDEVIASALYSSTGQEEITNLLLDNLLANPYSLANRRTVRFLGEKINSEILSRMLCFDPDIPEVWEEIIRAASRLGPPAVEMIKPAFGDLNNPMVDYAICVLESAPVEESVDILLQNWDALWKEKKGLLLEAVRGIGSPRFLDPLQNELREGERHELEIYCLLCQINGVDDFRFRRAWKDLEKAKQAVSRRAKALERADIDKLLEEPVEVETRCLACGKSYNYLVRKILVDMDSNHQFIQDGIVCKNCGVFDNYEITANGRAAVHRMSLLSRLKESQSGSPAKSPISFTRQAMIDGKKMSMSEILPWCESKLKAEPRNIANMIAYANVLRNQKRTEDAVSVFEEALKIDPLAIEAHAAIATIQARKGDLKSSYDRFSMASEILHSGNYYKVGPLDIDKFKETLLDNLVDVGKALGVKPALSQGKAASSHAKTGRNDPCPCGSGKKYKKCCMEHKSEPELEGPSPSSTHDLVAVQAKALVTKVTSFARNDRFHDDFFNAVALYWRLQREETMALPETAKKDKGEFNEWYVNDYVLSSGKTVMEEFSHAVPVTPVEEEIIKSHIASYSSLFEVQQIMENDSFIVKDILTGEEFGIKDAMAKKNIAAWDILMMRVLSLSGEHRIAGNILSIPRKLKDGLISFLNLEFGKFKEENIKAEWPQFLKRKSYIIRHYLQDLSREKPVNLTDGSGKMIIAKAMFDLKFFDKAMDLLEEEYDFAPDMPKNPNEKCWAWLKRGKSRELGEAVDSNDSVAFQTKVIHESGKLEWVVLGNVAMAGDRLTLECFSKGRLDAGKGRLMQVLKDCVRHKADSFEDVTQSLERARQGKRDKKPETLSEEKKLYMRSYLENYYRQWLDDKIPALGGRTPREAVQDEKGRQNVLEMLRDLENDQEKKRQKGEPCFNVDFMKKELGFI